MTVVGFSMATSKSYKGANELLRSNAEIDKKMLSLLGAVLLTGTDCEVGTILLTGTDCKVFTVFGMVGSEDDDKKQESAPPHREPLSKAGTQLAKCEQMRVFAAGSCIPRNALRCKMYRNSQMRE